MHTKKKTTFFPAAAGFLLILSLLGYLLLFPQRAADSARNGLLLWYHSVLPVIFPFLFLGSVLVRTIRAEDLPGVLTRPLRRLFGCSPYGAFAILAGFLCGLPVGAKLTSDLYREQKIERSEALHMIGFVNNLSPGFLFSYAAVGQLKLTRFAWCLPVSVLGAALLFGCAENILRTNHQPSLASSRKPSARSRQGISKNQEKTKIPADDKMPGRQESVEISKSRPALGETLNDCIFDAMESALRLCAYILLFAILSGALMQAAPMDNPFVLLLVSSIEATNGIRLLAASALSPAAKYLAAAALAAFGGFSALAQSIGIAHMDREFLICYIKSRVKITLLAILFASASLLLQNSSPKTITHQAARPLQAPAVYNSMAPPSETALSGSYSQYHSRTEQN